MKFADYPRVESLRLDDIMLIDGTRGTKSVLVENAIATITGEQPTEPMLNPEELTVDELSSQFNGLSVLLQNGLKETNFRRLVSRWFTTEISDSLNGTGILPSSIINANTIYAIMDILAKSDETIRRNIYRGRHLGDVPTDVQLMQILDGDYTGMFIGDWWGDRTAVGSERVIIADFDYYKDYDTDGSPNQIAPRHIVLLTYIPTDPSYVKMDQLDSDGNPTKFYPDTGLAERLKNDYAYSYLDIYLKSGLEDIDEPLIPYLKVIKRVPYMQDYDKVVSKNYLSPAWIPSHSQIFGYPPEGSSPAGTGTTMEKQLALFKLNPNISTSHVPLGTYWLRDNRIVDSSIDGIDYKGRVECGSFSMSRVTFETEKTGALAKSVSILALVAIKGGLDADEMGV